MLVSFSDCYQKLIDYGSQCVGKRSKTGGLAHAGADSYHKNREDYNKLVKEIPQAAREREASRYGTVNYYVKKKMQPEEEREVDDITSVQHQVHRYADDIIKVGEKWKTNDIASVAAFLHATDGQCPETPEEVTFLRSAAPEYLDSERKVVKNNPRSCASTYDFHTLELGSIEFATERGTEKYPVLVPIERYIYERAKGDSPFAYPSHPTGGLNVIIRHKDASGNPFHWVNGNVNIRLNLRDMLNRSAQFNPDKRAGEGLLIRLQDSDEAPFTCVSQKDEKILSQGQGQGQGQ